MRLIRRFEKLLVELYSFRYFVFYIVSVAWLPFTQAMAESGQKRTTFMTAVSTYSSEAIIIASCFTLLLGSFLSTRYEPPVDVPVGNRMDTTTKFFFSIGGGVAAFLYILDEKQMLTILHPLWVLGVSIVTPSFVQIAFPVIVRIWYKIIKSKEEKLGND